MQLSYFLLPLLPLLAASQDINSIINNAQGNAASILSQAGIAGSNAGAIATSALAEASST